MEESFISYCQDHTSHESELLKNIKRFTHLYTSDPNGLSNFLQGQFLSFLSILKKPNIILEIGTFTAYATVCLAEGLAPGGRIISIESNPERKADIDELLSSWGKKDNLQLIIGDALEILPRLKTMYDLVFIDAAKKKYKNCYDLIIDQVNPDGLIIVDNVWWKGKVADPNRDSVAEAIHEFNQSVKHDDRVENIILPMLDGIMLIRKKVF